jgi:hypothetical protein
VKAPQHPEPKPRPTVGGSFTLDPPTGEWLPTVAADAVTAPTPDPEPLIEAETDG